MCHDTLWDLGSSDRKRPHRYAQRAEQEMGSHPPAYRDRAKSEGEINVSADQLPRLLA
jgi:hypothetical protein